MSADHRHEMEEPLGEYTRRKIKVQLGDGPDRRGEATVEEVREAGTGFADWKLEVDRVTDTLREKLDLPPKTDDAPDRDREDRDD